MSDFIGLPGFIMRSAYNATYPTQGRKQPVYLHGSRQMESTSKAYYEKNLGAGMFIAPEVEHGFTGYTEPLRRFIQPEGYTPQVNEIENQMPSSMPGGDYLVNFRKGNTLFNSLQPLVLFRNLPSSQIVEFGFSKGYVLKEVQPYRRTFAQEP